MKLRRALVLAAFLHAHAGLAQPVGTELTYQGELRLSGNPVAGAADFRFRLYTAPAGGSQVGTEIPLAAAPLVSGRFTAPLDFGPGSFGPDARWLEIDVRSPAGSGSYSTLTPRQRITVAPVAQFALSGNPGPQGAQGPQGSAGAQGAPGTTGSQGASGPQGSAGAQGIPGTPGPQGATGAPGAPGIPWSLSGSTAYYNAGSVGIGTSSPDSPLHVITSGDQAIHGISTTTGSLGIKYGVIGESNSAVGRGVYGRANATLSGIGVYGEAVSPTGIGTFGFASSDTGANYGVFGRTDSTTGAGVMGRAFASGNVNYGVRGKSDSTLGYGVYGESAGPAGVYGLSTHTLTSAGVRGEAASTMGYGVYGHATSPTGDTSGGVFISDSSDGTGVRAIAQDYGVYAYADGISARAVHAQTGPASTAGRAVSGVAGTSSIAAYGVYGLASAPAYAVYANGQLAASGTKSFRIDHPSDPANKFLVHYCAESPEVINFYRGTVTLDRAGNATVDLPAYFALVNTSPSYMLTAVGSPMPMLHVSQVIDASALAAGAAAEPGEPAPPCSFRIAGGTPGGTVSWRVEAVRNDRWVRAAGAPVEPGKEGTEKGTYQHPDLYNQPMEMGVDRPDPRHRETRP